MSIARANMGASRQSIDGVNWFVVGASEAPMVDECLIGFAAAGERQDAVITTAYDLVAIRNRYQNPGEIMRQETNPESAEWPIYFFISF